jgi:sulfite reductase (NADPH) flavoprotein alpha-component
VIGTWVLVLYLLAALTGLYWSYDWYRDGLFALTGASRPANVGPVRGGGLRPDSDKTKQGDPPQEAIAAPDLDAIWEVFMRESGGYSTATLRLPERPGDALQITYLAEEPAHNRANNRLNLDPVTGAVQLHERYADKAAGGKLMASMFALHSGSFFGLPGLILVMLASLVMPVFAVTGWMLYLDRRRKKHIGLQRRQKGGDQSGFNTLPADAS